MHGNQPPAPAAPATVEDSELELHLLPTELVAAAPAGVPDPSAASAPALWSRSFQPASTALGFAAAHDENQPAPA